jgi:Flp pilus assembly protein TadB
MAGGIVLIIAGILIAIYPPLLSIIVAILLIMLGIMLISVSHYHRKQRRRFDNPDVELFFRF